ncbi:SMI1/KNR4 family protein [Empedobacter sedimenti]|uniref:SMI1/KNR4 family protein n=1 Tax=Empedobacter sedimenti TaxID=3042610 RepID=UPI0024A67884|nr:SMI1/KNR4 family protein [Empedobacter sedimenti]
MHDNYKNAIKTLQNWIKANEVILETKKWKEGQEILEIEHLKFSVQTLASEEIEAIKNFTKHSLPDSYYYFLKEIGTGSFFFSEYIGGFELYNLAQLQEYNELFQQEIEEPIDDEFMIIGSHISLGDWMGFCTSKTDEKNFDVYCHEYPIDEYAETSDELNSWRTFEEWIVKVVETKGRESL